MQASLVANSPSQSGSEFNRFLFAPVGEDGTGMLVTVLSALARLDLDPWQEAANLARLPGLTATERLTSLLAALPDRLLAQPDSGTIAARLIALLPRPAISNLVAHQTLWGGGAVTRQRALAQVIFASVISLALMLGAQYLISSHQPRQQLGDGHPPASDTGSPTIPPSNSGQ